MLDVISLSEEELGVLFSPALYEAVSIPTLTSRSSRKSVNQAPVKRMAKRAAKITPNMTLLETIPARCGYRTGKCQNLQAFKRNGKLHKLCEVHRERANQNQKKLDRKKRMQRSKLSPSFSSCQSVSSEDEVRSIDIDAATCSPRTVEAAVTSSLFVKTEATIMAPDELNMELIVPTNFDEAPLALGCEELAIFYSLMTFDINHQAPVNQEDLTSVRTLSCHYYTTTV